MAIQSILSATVTAATISAVANILAQGITAYQEGVPLVVHWVPVFQFFVFTCIQTPPNFLWQTFLEELFPAYTQPVTPPAKGQRPAEPQLNVANTVVKVLLDQTVGAAANTYLFSMTMHALQDSMRHAPRAPHKSVEFLASGNALDYSKVDWNVIGVKAKREFYPLLSAGWKFWPFVSLFNFSVVKTVELRNLVGALAGLVWGVYMSLFAAGK